MGTMRDDLYFGLFHWQSLPGGSARLTRPDRIPPSIPDPKTGRHLRISTVQASTRAICPSCAGLGDGGFVSFEDDLRIAYACPECRELIWIRGA